MTIPPHECKGMCLPATRRYLPLVLAPAPLLICPLLFERCCSPVPPCSHQSEFSSLLARPRERREIALHFRKFSFPESCFGKPWQDFLFLHAAGPCAGKSLPRRSEIA